MGIFRRDEPYQSPNEFWTEIEEKRGGKVRFYTFSRYIGRMGSGPDNLAGLLYVIDNTVYFEDFEKDNMLLKLVGRKKKYEKTEFHFQIDQMTAKRVVTRNSALNCISGIIAAADVKNMSAFQRLWSNPVYLIELNDGSAIFFEQVMDQKKFLAALAAV